MKREVDPVELIDFAAGVPTPRVSYTGRLPLGNVTLGRCIFPPNPGVTLGSKQAIVAVHSDPSFELEWRPDGRSPDFRQYPQRGAAASRLYQGRSDCPRISGDGLHSAE